MAFTIPKVAELLAQRQALEEQLDKARERETRLALIEIVQKMREYGITLHELIGKKAVAEPAEPEGAVKYRDPATGATWSGRGRAPRSNVGKNRYDFAVSGRPGGRA